jgi:hypothetical protein
MKTWLKTFGTLQIDNDVVRLAVSEDFAKYYKSLIDKEVRLFTGLPAHGCHITLWRNSLHGDLCPKKAKFLKDFYKKNKILFEYDPYIVEGGGKAKKFRNWYMHVRSMAVESICKYLGNEQYKHLHITLCNTKNGERPYIWMK